MTDNFQLYRQFIEACGGLPDTNEKSNLGLWGWKGTINE